MSIKISDAQLGLYIEEQKYIKITRVFENDDTDQIRGFLLDMSENFFLIQKEEEFQLNGISVITREEIHSIVSGEYEERMKFILEKEGIFNSDIGTEHFINLTSWHTVFSDLEQQDFHVIVECENDEDPDFFIGPISELTEESVGIRYYTPSAVLDVDATFIDFDEITTVTFNDRYTKVYRKYLRTDE